MYDKVPKESTLQDNNVDKELLKRDKFETLKREEKARWAAVEEVQHRIHLSTKVAVNDKIPKRDNKKDTSTHHARVNGTAHEGS